MKLVKWRAGVKDETQSWIDRLEKGWGATRVEKIVAEVGLRTCCKEPVMGEDRMGRYNPPRDDGVFERRRSITE